MLQCILFEKKEKVLKDYNAVAIMYATKIHVTNTTDIINSLLAVSRWYEVNIYIHIYISWSKSFQN